VQSSFGRRVSCTGKTSKHDNDVDVAAAVSVIVFFFAAVSPSQDVVSVVDVVDADVIVVVVETYALGTRRAGHFPCCCCCIAGAIVVRCDVVVPAYLTGKTLSKSNFLVCAVVRVWRKMRQWYIVVRLLSFIFFWPWFGS
jgi:hypothetical protein